MYAWLENTLLAGVTALLVAAAIRFLSLRPALAHLCEQLAAEHVNIDYCYVSAAGKNGRTFGIFKVSNVEKASRIVSGANNVQKRKTEKRPLRERRSYTALD